MRKNRGDRAAPPTADRATMISDPDAVGEIGGSHQAVAPFQRRIAVTILQCMADFMRGHGYRRNRAAVVKGLRQPDRLCPGVIVITFRRHFNADFFQSMMVKKIGAQTRRRLPGKSKRSPACLPMT